MSSTSINDRHPSLSDHGPNGGAQWHTGEMGRDQILTDLYNGLMTPFPTGLGGKVIDGVDLLDLDDDIAGAASHYTNNTRPLTADHRIWLAERIADVDRIEMQLPDEAREYFAQRRDFARYLLATR